MKFTVAPFLVNLHSIAESHPEHLSVYWSWSFSHSYLHTCV